MLAAPDLVAPDIPWPGAGGGPLWDSGTKMTGNPVTFVLRDAKYRNPRYF